MLLKKPVFVPSVLIVVSVLSLGEGARHARAERPG